MRTGAVLSLLAGLLVSQPAEAVVPEIRPAVPLTEAQAVRQAAATGERVEVPGKTTETSRVLAEPDGSMTAELNAAPVRSRQGSEWVPIDTTLEFAPDGSVHPRAAADLTLSGGGAGSLARLGIDDDALTMSSPWSLPKPVLSGSTATYGEVLPGVDLVVEATREAFTYNVVVKNRAAAQNPALDTVRFPITKDGLNVRKDAEGRAEYIDSTGRLALIVGEALMWDSAGGPAGKAARSSASAVEGGPVGGAHVAEMDFHGTGEELTFRPDAAMMDSAQTVFPVVLDPVFKRQTRNAWAAAWQLYPTTSFFKTSHDLGVGYEGFEQHKIVRSWWQFDVSPFLGKKVLKADFRVYEVHSASCSARQVTVTRSGPISAATTWNKQPAAVADIATKSFAHGYTQSCPNAAEEFNVTSSLTTTLTGGGRTATFRLRATDETDEIAWKQFEPTYGQLDVSFISPPLAPDMVGLADPAVGCKPSTAVAYIGDLTPKFQARVRVSATETSARVYATWEVYNSAGTLVVNRSSGQDVPNTLMTNTVANALADQTTFHVRAKTVYPYTGGSLSSPWSGWCYFRTDSTIPPPPTVTAKYGTIALKDCGTEATCPDDTPYGGSVSFTFKGNAADVVKHVYHFQNARLPGESAGLTSTKGLVPPEEGWNTISVQSQDAAGHLSGVTEFTVNIKAQSGPIGSWSFNEGTGMTAADAAVAPAVPHALTLMGGATFDDVGRSGASLQTDGVNDYASNATTIVDTSKSFTISAWARVRNTTTQGVVAAAMGEHGSAFELYYSGNKWIFQRMVTDAVNPAIVKATSDDVALWGAWTHLAGVYDANAQKLQLYVNGRLQNAGNVAFTPIAWKATKAFTVGIGRYNDALVAPFFGTIDQVQLWQRALRTVDIQKVAAFMDPADPLGAQVSGLVGNWPLNSAYNSADQIWRTGEPVYTANLEIRGVADPAAAFVDDDERGRVLELAGNPGEQLNLARPVVDAGGSFTVAVWVKLSDPTKRSVIVRQGPTSGDRDTWRLEFEPTSTITGRWIFARGLSAPDPADPAKTEQIVISETDLDSPRDDWHLLIATYDAMADPDAEDGVVGRIALSVDRYRAADGAIDFHSALRTGATQLAAGRNGGQFGGRMDDLRMYAGVLTDERACEEFPEVGDCGTEG
ncbi:LamG-like jellyroll fold domain-containing protein [Kribbella sp. NPDC056951]|uniref:LamG-like jellyroll fold domain-containing protein n=1 Tax=Kribbella sp. NPDC056951 TaxID=3345978 RepID=UPI00363A71CC